MNLKTLTLLIIFSVLVGILIFMFSSSNNFSQFQKVQTKGENLTPSSPAPTPKPTLIPLDENSNLEEELEKTTPQEFSEDIKSLRESI